ncbi:MAG: phenylacetate--CoA ligase family protein [Candidatus Doudnabacteria bacterium]
MENKNKNIAIEFLSQLSKKPEPFWLANGEKMALDLFYEMAARVPAYKKFLKKHKIDPLKIKTMEDFKKVPLIDKDNYLKAYPYEELFIDGKFNSEPWVFSSTSGTTGEPFYFPRTDQQDLQYALTAEMYLRTNFDIHKKSTLYIDAFAMGPWIGGLFTYQALKHLVKRGGYKMSIITTGVNKSEVLKAISKLGRKYDQVIIGAYPPFLNDILDEGVFQKLNWGDYNLKLIFSAEGFSEAFRDAMAKKAGLKNILKDTLNHYGTVDLGTMSHETPVSILARREAVADKDIYFKLFGQISHLPTLTQYLPEMFYFENLKGNLVCTSRGGIPLVRYDLKDRGGILKLSEVNQILPNLQKQMAKEKLSDTVWNLPFVYVYERSDLVVTWYGANIYPEHVKAAHHHNAVAKYLSGKFTMEVTTDKDHYPVLEVHTELKKNVKGSQLILRKLKSKIISILLEKNSEFKNSYFSIPEHRRKTRINLFAHESAPHFKPGGKQKWVIK